MNRLPLAQALRFLGEATGMAPLLTQIDQQERLLNRIRQRLEPDLGPHCLHARLAEGRLTLVTDSPAWASRLRFQARDLIRDLGSEQEPVRECRVRVLPQTGPREAALAGTRPGLSAATRRLLMQAAAAQGETALGRAWRRLAWAGVQVAEEEAVEGPGEPGQTDLSRGRAGGDGLAPAPRRLRRS